MKYEKGLTAIHLIFPFLLHSSFIMDRRLLKCRFQGTEKGQEKKGVGIHTMGIHTIHGIHTFIVGCSVVSMDLGQT